MISSMLGDIGHGDNSKVRYAPLGSLPGVYSGEGGSKVVELSGFTSLSTKEGGEALRLTS